MVVSVLDSLNAGLQRAFERDERVLLIGEDVLDPYGGAFKVTRGLSTRFAGRVLTTPISEAGITGLAAGMALRGLRPVVEIMFGDFVTLIADQVINHAAKYRQMYNQQVRVPLVIRTPMGGRRGYGPTHSQTLEKLFLGVPGLRVLAACSLGEPGALLERVILETEDPVLFVENKLLYPLRLQDELIQGEFEVKPDAAGNYTLTLRGAPRPGLSIAAYGYMAELARQAVVSLAYENEIFAELVIFTQLSPFNLNPLLASLEQTERLLSVEEGSGSLGWGAEVLARCFETRNRPLRAAERVTALSLPIPSSPVMEREVLPGVEEIKRAALRLAGI